MGVALPSDYEDAGSFKIAVKCDFPGFGFKTGGKVEGFEADIARKMAEYAFGNENAAKLECVTADSRVPYLQSGRADMVIATMGITPERQEVIAFSEPYMSSEGQFLTRAGEEFEELDALDGKRVVTDSGAPWMDWMRTCIPGAEIVTLAGEATQLQALTNKKVDAILEDSSLLVNVIAKSDNFTITGPDLPQLGFAWGIGMEKKDADLKKWVDAAIEQMQEEDFFWESVKQTMPEGDMQSALEKSIRRPEKTPKYEDYAFSYPKSDAAVSCD